MPFFLEAAILSRIRSPVTSRSNWAKERSTFRVSRPMEVVVLNCWVTETKETPHCVEQFDDPGEVGEGAGQAVDLVDHHGLDPALPGGSQEAGEGRALHGPARIAAVVEPLGDQMPALMPLAPDEGLAGFPLGVQGIEVLLEAILGGLAGVDGAAASAGHNPKNLRPDQRAPVIPRATLDSERYRWPS